MIRKNSIILFIIILITKTYAQVPIAVGQWRTHFNYTEGNEITCLNDDVFSLPLAHYFISILTI